VVNASFEDTSGTTIFNEFPSARPRAGNSTSPAWTPTAAPVRPTSREP
jgi:hypothetical protein